VELCLDGRRVSLLMLTLVFMFMFMFMFMLSLCLDGRCASAAGCRRASAAGCRGGGGGDGGGGCCCGGGGSGRGGRGGGGCSGRLAEPSSQCGCPCAKVPEVVHERAVLVQDDEPDWLLRGFEGKVEF
jgi:hypothetical protein